MLKDCVVLSETREFGVAVKLLKRFQEDRRATSLRWKRLVGSYRTSALTVAISGILR